MERKVFTDLSGQNSIELNDALSRIGFRRSQGVAYRPSCINCTACVSVRILADQFQPSTSQKRIYKRNRDLEVTVCHAWSTAEQFNLLHSYLEHRHPTGGMAGMDEIDFADMVEQSPVDTHIVEYREPSVDGRPGELVGVCLSDKQHDGFSMIYSFFKPDCEGRSGLGTYIIMDHAARAARAGLPFVYLGYWIDGCRRMEYKTRFQPMEALGPEGWSPYQENSAEPAAAPLLDPALLLPV